MVLPIASLGIVSQRPQAHKYHGVLGELSALKGGRAGGNGFKAKSVTPGCHWASDWAQGLQG